MHLVSQKGLGVSAFAKALSPAYGLTDYYFVFLLELVGEKYGRCPIWRHYRCGKGDIIAVVNQMHMHIR